MASTQRNDYVWSRDWQDEGDGFYSHVCGEETVIILGTEGGTEEGESVLVVAVSGRYAPTRKEAWGQLARELGELTGTCAARAWAEEQTTAKEE